MKGVKTSGGSSSVWAIAVVIFWRREPVRFQAVWRAGWRVGGQWAVVLTVMIDFSWGICENPSCEMVFRFSVFFLFLRDGFRGGRYMLRGLEGGSGSPSQMWGKG